MEQPNRPADASRRIDLRHGADVEYWCRLFNVTMEQLRDAVHHAGHQADEVERWLRQRRSTPPH